MFLKSEVPLSLCADHSILCSLFLITIIYLFRKNAKSAEVVFLLTVTHTKSVDISFIFGCLFRREAHCVLHGEGEGGVDGPSQYYLTSSFTIYMYC